jgi:hypothetical protein
MGGSAAVRLGTAFLLVSFASAGCGAEPSALPVQVSPYKIQKIAGTDLAYLRLEPKAVERAEMRTEPVLAMTSGGATTSSASIPYAALMFAPDGGTFVYTNPDGSTFLRHSVAVERYDGTRVWVTNGPPAGTRVVTDGAAELWGVEFGVGK